MIARLLEDNRWRLDRRNSPISTTYLETIAEDGEPPHLLPHHECSNPKQAKDDFVLPAITAEETNELATEELYPYQHLKSFRMKSLGGIRHMTFVSKSTSLRKLQDTLGPPMLQPMYLRHI